MGTKATLGEPYQGHSGSMGKRDVAAISGVERVGEALRTQCLPATQSRTQSRVEVAAHIWQTVDSSSFGET